MTSTDEPAQPKGKAIATPYAQSKGSLGSGGPAVTGYRPMTLADLAGRLARTADGKVRWKLVWEFLEEYRWEPADAQLALLHDEPPPTGDERWDTLLAALAEHLAARHDAAPPSWAEFRVLRQPWFPAELRVQRADALVWAPAAFRKHGVYLSARGSGGRVTDPGDVLFGRAELERAFTALGERLARRGVVADIFVVGGAAMALAYDADRVTRDVDARFVPHGIVLDEARQVARDLGLPPWWLNEQATAYISGKDDPGKRRVFDHPGLRVMAASPEHVFAMKALAARTRDIDDLRLLAGMIGIENSRGRSPGLRELLPDEPIPPRTDAVLREFFSSPEPARTRHRPCLTARTGTPHVGRTETVLW